MQLRDLAATSKIFVIPGEDAIETIEKVLFFTETVRLSRVYDQFSLHAVALQAAIQLLALAEWIGGVGITLKNQSRRFRILEMRKRGTVQELQRGFLTRTARRRTTRRRKDAARCHIRKSGWRGPRRRRRP